MPTDLTQLLEVIRANGDIAYAFLLSYAAAHSLLLVLFAGYAAHLGALDVSKVFLISWAGSFLGDVIRFYVARRFGPKLLKKFPALERGVERFVRLVDKHYTMILMVHRYPHGIRSLAAFACGIASVPAIPFVAISFVSAGIWAAIIVSIGYGFGHLSEKVLTDAASGVSVAALLLFLGGFWLLSKKLESAIQQK
jgi:membrane protein DedA with SNARE-associated domain